MLKTVSRHLTGIEAHIIRTRLEAENIPAFINSEHYIGLDWSLALALGYIQVQVPKSYLEAAQQVLDNIDQGIYQAELEADPGIDQEIQPVCAKCGSHEINPVVWPGKLSLLTVFMYAFPLPYTQHLKRCQACHSKWIAHQEQGYPLYIPASYTLICASIITAIILAVSPPLDFYLIEDYEVDFNEDGHSQNTFELSDDEPPTTLVD